jgi:hypothetical protein
MLRHLFCATLFAAATPLAAAPPQPGHWAVTTAGGVVMRFDLAKGAEGWSGSLLRPIHFSFGDGEFSQIQAETRTFPASHVREVGGDLELTIPDPAPGEAPAMFLLHAIDATHATASIVGAPIEPLPLLRTDVATPIAPFDPQLSYALVVERPTNAEMSQIFAADQADRGDPAHIDWAVVGKADEARRARTWQLLDDGQLQSGDDFYHAAFVFQHGNEPADYLKAHLFAMVAMARGKPSAKWIAAATLDRYLNAIGQKQVLGTQFKMVDGKPVTDVKATDESIVPDSVREALGVPPLGQQQEQMEQLLSRGGK